MLWRRFHVGMTFKVSGELSREGDDFAPIYIEKRTSAAEAVKRIGIYGTAEPVPFVRQSLRTGEGFVCCRLNATMIETRQTESTPLDTQVKESDPLLREPT